MSGGRIPTSLDYAKAYYSSGSRALLRNLAPDTRGILDLPTIPDNFNYSLYNPLDPSVLGGFTLSKDAAVVANFAAAAAVGGGVITGITGTNPTDGLSIFGSLSFNGALNAFIEARMNLSVITSQQQEFGFANIVTDKTLPIVSDLDGTPTVGNGATEAAVFVWDPAETVTTPRLVTAAVGRTNAGDTYTLVNGDGSRSTTAWAPTAGADYKIRIFLMGRNPDGTSLGTYASVISYAYDANMALVAMASINGSAAGTGVTAGGVTAATAMAPWVFQNTSNGTSKTLNLSYLLTGTQRS